MAVLVAFVLAWETLALDDALTFWDAMLAVIIRVTPERLGRKTARLADDLDSLHWRSPARMFVLLKEETYRTNRIRAEGVQLHPKRKLAEIITLVREIARPSDDTRRRNGGAVRARSSFRPIC